MPKWRSASRESEWIERHGLVDPVNHHEIVAKPVHLVKCSFMRHSNPLFYPQKSRMPRKIKKSLSSMVDEITDPCSLIRVLIPNPNPNPNP